MNNISKKRVYTAIALMKGHVAPATERNRHFPICIMGNDVSSEGKQEKCKLDAKHVKYNFPQFLERLVIWLRLLFLMHYIYHHREVSRASTTLVCLTSVRGLSVNNMGHCVLDG